MKRIPAVVFLFTCGASSAVFAFPNGQFWNMPASGDAGVNRAGAGSIYYTGSIQDFGLKCSHCHVEGAGLIGVTITPSPAWQMVGGEPGYSPGQTYTLTIAITNEHRGLAQGNNNANGITAAFEDASGATVGVLTGNTGATSASCPATWPGTQPVGTTHVYGDCRAIVFINSPNLVTWDFQWQAPAAGVGDVTLFYGAVDGDSGAESSLGDDVKEGSVVLHEGT